jgi:hypothetical protein
MKTFHHAFVSLHYNILSSFLIVIFLLSCCPTYSIENKYSHNALSPEQVVELFHKSFGTSRMDEIGPYTTGHFRDDLPISVWISKTWDELKSYGYKKTKFKLLEKEYSEDKNHIKITVAAKIETDVGSAAHKENYFLIKEAGFWLIDELIVTDEIVDEEVFEL